MKHALIKWGLFVFALPFMFITSVYADANTLDAATSQAANASSQASADAGQIVGNESDGVVKTSAGHAYTHAEVTVVGSKENARDLTGSGAYLDNEDINKHSYDDINRVLRKVPGVYVREEDGYGLFPNISLRGVDPGRSGKVTVMEDGVLTAPAPYSAPSAYYTPTTGRMEAIEVLKGSSQIKYGPHTTGGVINYISTPVPEDFNVFAKVMGGTDFFREDAEFRSHVHIGDTLDTGIGNIGYLIESYIRWQDGFKFIDEKPGIKDPDATGFRKFDHMIKMFWEPDTDIYQRFEFKAGNTYQDANETYTGLNTEDFRNNPFRRYAATRFDNIESNHVRTMARYIAEIVPETLKVSITGYYNYFYRNWEKLHDRIDSAAIPGTGDRLSISQALESPMHLAVLKGDSAGSFRVRNNRRYYFVAGLDSKINYELDLGPTHHNFEFGYRLNHDEIYRYQNNITYTQNNGGQITNEAIGAGGGAGNRDQHTEAHAFYWHDEMTWGNLTLNGGLRWEWILPDFEDFNSGAERKDNYDVLAPGISMNYQFTDEASIFGGWHRGFSVPSPSGATGGGNQRPETSDNYEVGLRYDDPKRALSSEVVYFFTDFDNLLVADSIGGAGSGMTVNAGDINSQGVEFLLNYDPAQHLEQDFNTPSYFAFTVTHARFDGVAQSADAESIFSAASSGNKVPYVPEYQISFGTGFEMGRFSAYIDGHFVPKMFTSASNIEDQINPNTGVRDARFGQTDSHLVFDLSSEFKLTDDISLIGNIHNLTDQEYIVSRHPHGPRPGRPMSATAGVKVNWG